MTYPFIIFIFLIIAICIVMIYVLPQIRQIIDQAQGDLPFSTRSLMAVSGFLQEHFMLILLVLIGIGMI
jgi:type II secretory pathway component PulF